MTFDVVSRRVDAHGSVATCKSATIQLDTDLAGNLEAFNPAELLLAAVSACMIKGIERVAPILKFQFRGVEVRAHGVRQDAPGTALSGVLRRAASSLPDGSAHSFNGA